MRNVHTLAKGEVSEGIRFQVQDICNRKARATSTASHTIRYVVNEIRHLESIEGPSSKYKVVQI